MSDQDLAEKDVQSVVHKSLEVLKPSHLPGQRRCPAGHKMVGGRCVKAKTLAEAQELLKDAGDLLDEICKAEEPLEVDPKKELESAMLEAALAVLGIDDAGPDLQKPEV